MKNRLDRIVTKSGDSGVTSINPNKRISKNSNIVNFLGDLDELNAYIGTLKADLFIINPTENSLEVIYTWITTIQHIECMIQQMALMLHLRLHIMMEKLGH